MFVKTPAVLLHAVKYGETSLILNTYTQALGRRSYIVSGVRKTNARMAQSQFQVMSLLNIVAYERPDKDLHRLKEASPYYVYTKIPFEWTRAAVGMFMAELVLHTVKERTPHEALFEYLLNSFIFLDQTQEQFHHVHLAFGIQLAQWLGFGIGEGDTDQPYFDLSAGIYVTEPPVAHGLDREETELWRFLSQHSLSDSHRIESSRRQRAQLTESILRFYQIHQPNFHGLHSHAIYKSLFNSEGM